MVSRGIAQMIRDEWKRFFDGVLAGEGRSAKEIRGLRDVFYAGSAAAIDAVGKILGDSKLTTGQKYRALAVLMKEMKRFQQGVMARKS